MADDPSIPIPITRPHLPPMERFSEVIADLLATRMLSNFAKYTRLLESRATTVLDHPAPLCVSSCDAGLVLAWRALDCPPGEVIVPTVRRADRPDRRDDPRGDRGLLAPDIAAPGQSPAHR
jgi:dTDP-4-amino-4,6-dideoxygalactose transaminase